MAEARAIAAARRSAARSGADACRPPSRTARSISTPRSGRLHCVIHASEVMHGAGRGPDQPLPAARASLPPDPRAANGGTGHRAGAMPVLEQMLPDMAPALLRGIIVGGESFRSALAANPACQVRRPAGPPVLRPATGQRRRWRMQCPPLSAGGSRYSPQNEQHQQGQNGQHDQRGSDDQIRRKLRQPRMQVQASVMMRSRISLHAPPDQPVRLWQLIGMCRP